MGRLTLFALILASLLTGCSKIRSEAKRAKTKSREMICRFFSDFSKDCPESCTFDNYPGFRDWYRFPIHYPYHFLLIDTQESGCLEKYDGGDIRDPNRSSVPVDDCTDIVKLGWTRDFLIFERADHRFGLFFFESGKCGIFDSRSERDKVAGLPLPEEKAPSVYFTEFRK